MSGAVGYISANGRNTACDKLLDFRTSTSYFGLAGKPDLRLRIEHGTALARAPGGALTGRGAPLRGFLDESRASKLAPGLAGCGANGSGVKAVDCPLDGGVSRGNQVGELITWSTFEHFVSQVRNLIEA